MAGVLTTSSTVKCGHGSGKVSTSSSTKLTVSGSPVLTKDGINGKSVSSCGTQAAADASGTPTATPCSSVLSVIGEAMKLTLGGQAAMLDALSGSTDGMVAKVTPQLLLSAQAGQTKLTAV